jgi:phenylpyruvate tautomerase PptA (4-oxalocrotonate tautomerase family)
MPILDVEIVGDVQDPRPTALAQALADEAGRIFASAPGTTWVRLRTLAPSDYAENAETVSARPVFVTVMKRQVPARAELAQEIAALTRAVARLVGRPAENVHVTYEPAAAGRAAFGGKIQE